MRTLSVAALAALLAIALAGCDRFVVTIKTRIDPGGRLEREMRISNVGEKGPTTVERAFKLPASARIVERSEDGETIVLALSARSPEELEPDFAVRAEGAEKAGRPPPRNAVEWRKRDCVLFDHWVYRETFHDSVDEADRDGATDRLFGLCRQVVVTAAALEAAGRYDLGALERYLDGPARHLFFDLVRIACTEKDEKRRERRIAARLGAEGVAAPVGEGGDAVARALSHFAIGKLAELLVPKEKGLAPFDATPFLSGDERATERLLALLKYAATAHHGSEEKAEEAFLEALGAVRGDMEGAPIEVRAHVAMPGRPLRTNGWLGEPDPRETRVFFEFEAEDVARTGHVLELETVVLKPEVLARVPSGKASLEDEDVLNVIRWLSDRSDAERERLSKAFAALDGKRPPEEVEETLPEELRCDFRLLVGAGSRGE